MPEERTAQLAYSELMGLMLDDDHRRQKARKMARIIEHFQGVDDLQGQLVIDVGCSGGIVADELRLGGAQVIGFDIDRPGLASAQARFGATASFVAADSGLLPLRSASADVVICNHVYEHVVDPDALLAEIHRILKPTGAVYFGLGNRHGVMEPHYRLPFLSWLPRTLAHRYVRASGRADQYHEELKSRRHLRAMCHDFQVWDYTWSVLAEPERFGADDTVPSWFRAIPFTAIRAAAPIVPTYLWMGTTVPASPSGPELRQPPRRVATG